MTLMRHFKCKLRRLSYGWPRLCRYFSSGQYYFGAFDKAVSPKPRRLVRAHQFQLCQPQQGMAGLFAEQAFTADAIEAGEYAGLEQLFRRNTGPSQFLIECIERWRELFENRVHATLDGAQRMIRQHAMIADDYRQKVWLGLKFARHAYLMPLIPSCLESRESVQKTLTNFSKGR